jgi:hypothetical protein
MAFSVVLERLAAESVKIGHIGPALGALSGPLARREDAAEKTEAAAAHEEAANRWTIALGRYSVVCEDLSLALMAAMVCYDSADHFPGPAG